MFKNHLWVRKYDNCLSGSGLSHSKWCFLAPSICLQISRCRYFFCCIILHCVNVPHFPYLFFGRRACRLFPGSDYDKQCCYEHKRAHVLWYDWASFGCIPKSAITGYWGRLFPNFLRNRHTDIRRGCTSLPSHQQCRSVPFSPQSLQHKLSSVFLILAILTGVRWNLRTVLICISLTKDVEYFLKCLSAILDCSVESSLFRSVLHFLDCLFFWWPIFNFLWIFWRSVLCQMWGWWRSFPIL